MQKMANYGQFKTQIIAIRKNKIKIEMYGEIEYVGKLISIVSYSQHLYIINSLITNDHLRVLIILTIYCKYI